MAYQVTRKVFDTGIGAVGSKIVVTGAPSEPKAIMLKIAGNVGSANGVTNQDIRQCKGFGAKRLAVITEGVVGSAMLDNANSSRTRRWQRRDAVLEILDHLGAAKGRAFLDTMDSGGFTLEVAVAFDQSYRCEAIMLGGSSLTDAEIQDWVLPVVNGNFDVTNFNFQPDCLLMLSHWDDTLVFPDDRGGGSHSIGVCVSTSQQGFLSQRDQSNVPTTDAKGACHQGSECMAESRAGVTGRQAFVAFLANGVRLNMIESDNDDTVIGLALKGGDYTIKEILTETDTVTDIDVTGLPSEPAGGIVISGYRAEDAVNTQQSDNRESLGFWDEGGSQGVQGHFSEDSVGFSNTATGQRGDAVYQSINNISTQDGAMAFIAKSATAAKFRMIDADPSQRFAFGLFFGPAAAVVPPVVGPNAGARIHKGNLSGHRPPF